MGWLFGRGGRLVAGLAVWGLLVVVFSPVVTVGASPGVGGPAPGVVGSGLVVLSVSAGSSHSCAVLVGGLVKCWGENQYGQLGLGDTNDRGDGPGELGNSLPAVDLGSGRSATAVAAGGNHTCALLDDGSVKCWGLGGFGRLGLGDTANRGDGPGEMGDSLPAVGLGSGRSATAISVGSYHSCALLDNGSVKCWGANGYGRLGLGDTADRGDGPGEMGDALPAVGLGAGRSAVAVDVGVSHSCVVLDNATVKCWGRNNAGQLGLADTNNRGDGPGEMGDSLPAVVLGGRTATAVSAGGDHTCVVLDTAGVKCWGENAAGELGLGDTNDRGDVSGEMGTSLPTVSLGAGRTALAVSAGFAGTCVRLDDGSVKCWGANAAGQLGLGDVNNRGDGAGEMGNSLPAVNLGAGRTVAVVGLGSDHGCARLDDGSVRCWGAGTSGKLGQGDTTNRGDGPGEMGDALSAVDLGSAPTPGAMTVTVTADRGSYAPGDTAHLHVEVTNTGTVVLHNVLVTSWESTDDCETGPFDLAVGAVRTVDCSYPVDETWIDLGGRYYSVDVDSDETVPASGSTAFGVAWGPTGVSGTVTSSGSGSAVAGAWVAVLRTSDYSVAAGAVTDATGNYQVEVPAGSYFVYGIDPTGGHVAGFFGAPTTVTVVDHQMVDADPQMAPTRGSVAGTVTEAGSGTPIPQAWVIGINATTGATQRGAVANGSGQYSLGGLAVGSYRPVFVDPTGAHASRYFPNSVDFLGATSLAVTAGGSTAANVALPTQSTTSGAATLSGTVREAGTNTALGGVFVVALRASDFRNAGGAVTNVSGQYSLDVAAGDYKLAFVDSTGLHNMEWHDNQPNTGLATATSVTAPAVTGAALDANTGTLAGAVTDASGGPMGDAWILAIGPSGVAGGAITDEDGGYTIAGLSPGVYRAAIIDPKSGRAVEYFENSPDFAGATPLTVTAAHTTNADAALTWPGTQPPVFAGAWGGHGPGDFDGPQAMAQDPTSGEIYINDGFNRIQKFSATGIFLTQWGRYGHGHGQFAYLSALAVDSAGNVYASDNDNRIQKFSPTGTFLTQWGTTGTGNGQFNGIAGIAINPTNNNVYATGGGRIQRFTSSGTFVSGWNSGGDKIAVDAASGNVYVTSYVEDDVSGARQHFVVAYNSAGDFLAQWDIFPAYLGDGTPGGIAVVGGAVHVSLFGQMDIRVFSASGDLLAVIGGPGYDPGQFISPGALAAGPSGIYVADTRFFISGSSRIQRVDGGIVWSGTPGGDGEMLRPSGVVVDPSSGDVYVSDLSHTRSQKFTPTGTFVSQWARTGEGVAAFDPTTGDVYAVAGNEIRKYSPAGALLTQWGATGTGNGEFHGVGAIAVDPTGNVYVIDVDNYRVQKFSSTGTYLTQWGSYGDGDGQFTDFGGIAVDPISGSVYVTEDSYPERVQKFSSTGTYLTQWGGRGSGDGQFTDLGGIAVDPTSGNVYVTDTDPTQYALGRGINRVQEFSPSGAYLTQWGTTGGGNSQFRRPTGVAAGPNGNIYVVDSLNDRIQRFTQA